LGWCQLDTDELTKVANRAGLWLSSHKRRLFLVHGNANAGSVVNNDTIVATARKSL
jgi:hypothetical protein